jgi:hypothetical protein
MDAVGGARIDAGWRWARAEHGALVLVLAALVLRHANDVAWTRFLVAFAVIDLVGYVPGAIAVRRVGSGTIAPVYYHLYNVTHSYLTAGAVLGTWMLAHGGFEWAMLALPIHLSGDRGLLGKSYKPLSLPFEAAVERRGTAPADDRVARETR